MKGRNKEDANKVLKKFHDGRVGGHFGEETILHKILRVGYYWPILFKDAHVYTKK